MTQSKKAINAKQREALRKACRNLAEVSANHRRARYRLFRALGSILDTEPESVLLECTDSHGASGRELDELELAEWRTFEIDATLFLSDPKEIERDCWKWIARIALLQSVSEQVTQFTVDGHGSLEGIHDAINDMLLASIKRAEKVKPRPENN